MANYPREIWNFLKSKGFNDFAAAGLLGNIKAESDCNPQNLQNSYEKKLSMTNETYTQCVDNGTYENFINDRAGYGICQWTSSGRKKKLYNFLKEKNLSIGDLNGQLEFLYKELTEKYTGVYEVLKNATSIREASDIVLLKFEIPSNRDESVQEKRANYGQQYYDSYFERKGGTQNMKDYSKYIYSTGTHYISNSGSDENKKYTGGTAGDQTGHEWELRSWYSRPWTVVLRYEKDPRVGWLMANLGCAAALNNKIGYDQIQRTTYWTQLKAVGYDPEKITVACEEDCTAGVTSNAKAAGELLNIDSLKKLSTSIYSGNMKSNFVKAGFTALTASKYLTSSKYLLPGDVLLYESHHAATNVTVGSSIKSSYKEPNMTIKPTEIIPTPTPAPTPAPAPAPSQEEKPIVASGEPIGTAMAKQSMHIRDAAGTEGNSLAIVSKDTIVDVYELLDNGWMKIKYKTIVGYTSNRSNAYYNYVEKFKPYEAQVTGGKLNVRKGPNTTYGVKKVLADGTKVEVFNEQNNFACIDEKEGLWCSLKYLKKI